MIIVLLILTLLTCIRAIVAAIKMMMFQAADVIDLTGLTPNQLRDWSIRRNLISPDVTPSGPGRHALYSWQTVIILRLLREVHVKFAAEVGAWSRGMTKLREHLQAASFPGLWGTIVHFESPEQAVLMSSRHGEILSGLVLPLDPHLRPLAMKLSLSTPDQQTLFPALAVT